MWRRRLKITSFLSLMSTTMTVNPSTTTKAQRLSTSLDFSRKWGNGSTAPLKRRELLEWPNYQVFLTSSQRNFKLRHSLIRLKVCKTSFDILKLFIAQLAQLLHHWSAERIIYWTSASLPSIFIRAEDRDGFVIIFSTLVRKDSSDIYFRMVGMLNSFSNILSMYSS